MAAEKTSFIYHTSDNHSIELYTWLSENASEYFTKVVLNENNAISCFIDELEVLTLFQPYSTARYRPAKITLITGSTLELNSTSNDPVAYYTLAYKCDNGLFLLNVVERTSLFITKNNLGNTVILGCGMPNSSTRTSFIADIFNAPVITRLTDSNAAFYSHLTSMAPICTYTGKYVPNFYYVPFSPRQEQSCIITDNGKSYIFSYVFAMEV